MAGISAKIVRRSNALSNFQYGKDFGYEEAMIRSVKVFLVSLKQP